MCLRDRAISWYESLQEDNLNLDNWDVIKQEFMETYEPKY
jgi:Retrotransposon gag protein